MDDTAVLERTSVAKRVRAFFERCSSFPNLSISDAWIRAIGIPVDKSAPGLAVAELARRLSLVLPQLDLLDAKLRAEQPNMSAATSTQQVSRLKNFVGSCLANLQNPWTSVKGALSPDLMKCMEFWDELTEDDEIVLPNDELNALLVSLRDLRVQIESTHTNAKLKRVLLKIVEILSQGIIDYHIVGEDAIRAAGREAFSYILSNDDLLRENSDNAAVKSLGQCLGEFIHVCKGIIFADGLIHAAGTAQALVGGILKLTGHHVMP